MKSIDFLPDIYRQREALRRARVWWAVVVMLFGGAIGSSSAAQLWLRHSLQRQFDELAGEYAAAQAQVRELADLQAQIVKASQEAALVTYLEHPWPRTQLLAEVVRPLSEALHFTQLNILDEELPAALSEVGPRPPGTADYARPMPAGPELDLQSLQAEMDRRQTVIEVHGYTTDVARLHEYLAELSRSPLMAAANMKSLEAGPDKQQARTHFTLRLIVRPGYGQRGNEGDRAPPAPVILQTRTAAAGNQNAAARPAAGGGG